MSVLFFNGTHTVIIEIDLSSNSPNQDRVNYVCIRIVKVSFMEIDFSIKTKKSSRSGTYENKRAKVISTNMYSARRALLRGLVIQIVAL